MIVNSLRVVTGSSLQIETRLFRFVQTTTKIGGQGQFCGCVSNNFELNWLAKYLTQEHDTSIHRPEMTPETGASGRYISAKGPSIRISNLEA